MLNPAIYTGTTTPPPVDAAPDLSIRIATQDDAERCLEALTAAFENDPPCRWAWPDRRQYLEAFPPFARAFGGAAFQSGTAYCTSDLSGAALWLPPGVKPDEKSLIRIIAETVTEDRRRGMFSMFEQMEAYHPREPHWYLPLIGVKPGSQGRGAGSALQRRVLDHCDREGLLAYLEATSPRNIALYERLGFEALGRIQVDDSPPVVPMARQPR